MLSKQLTKVVQNLEKKKFRERYNLFKVEGEKLVGELLLSGLEIRDIIATSGWIERQHRTFPGIQVTEAGEKEMGKVSGFQSPPDVIALAEIPAYTFHPEEIEENLTIALDGIQDPGNLGTILRVADWFGVHHILCDRKCAGVYNSKCVQASMGAIFRVKTFYVELPAVLKELKNENYPVFGTFLDGENIYGSPLYGKGVIVMGNEGKGISEEIERVTDFKLTIPRFSTDERKTESLNVGVATGIVLSEFRRKTKASN